MYLKRLSLKGFKSFPTKTDIVFERGVTAVVGPNGSGKSNISDAIRWVLGEQSAKGLRGEKMEDVIFSGTDNKNEMNYCEVTLVLAEPSSIFNTRSEEISVKRRAYRNGESEFYINGDKCRLRDVRETLMDTGIGKDGYSIIEQGKVEELLSNNPANKRKIFDEACGISKFRYKKNEAEKNLKKSSNNLERILDIYKEIEEQLKPLERQQVKARKYLKLSEELKMLEINDILNKSDELRVQISDLDISIVDLDRELDVLENERKEIESNLSNDNFSLELIEKDLDELSEESINISETINNNNFETKLTREKINNKLVEIKRIKSEIELLEKKIALDEVELKKSNKSLEDNSFVIESLQKELEDLYEEKRLLENKVNDITKEIDDSKNFSLELLEKKQWVAQNYATMEANIDNIKNKIDSLEASNDSIISEILSSESEYGELISKIEDLNISLTENDDKIRGLNDLLREKSSKENEIKLNIQKVDVDISGLTNRMNAYIDMENHHEGFNRGVKEVLKNKELKGIFGALGEIISVPKKYEKSVEATLGAAIQNIVVENEDSAKSAINYLKKNNMGRVTFLPVSSMKSNKIGEIGLKSYDSLIGICSDLIDYDEKYRNVVENILGRVLVVDNIDNAIKISRETGNRYRIVTLEGDIINSGGSMTGGSLKNSTSILSRKRIIGELKVDIDKLQSELLDKNNILVSLCKEIENLKNSIEIEKTISNDITKNIMIAETDSKIFLDRLNDKRDLVASNDENIRLSILKLEEYTSEFDNFKSSLDEITTENEENISNTNELQSDLEKYSKQLEEFVKLFNEKNIELERKKHSFELIINESKRIEDDIETARSEKDSLTINILNYEKELDTWDEIVENLEVEIKQNTQAHDEIIEKIADKKMEKESFKEKLDESKKELRLKERSYSVNKDEKFKLSSKLERLKFSLENTVESLNEKYEIDLETAKDFKDDNIEISQEKIEKLRKSIKSLGNINLDSIEEYDVIKDRYEYYKVQKEDLETSIISINKLIEDLTENMKSEFVEKFEVINKNFKEVYLKLFGGGNANLRITDPENILNCDIEIFAQPPGKKMKNLSLLSGGERALTAICILFGILISKPTPFCILDEIEAPLDDVNVFRFGKYLKELSKDTQFIAVTHRRGTMEVADYIYGVTMQEKGISSILSIKLSEATKIAE